MGTGIVYSVPMMQKIVAALCLFVLMLSCNSDESWKNNLIGTGEIFDADNALGPCANAVYDNWEESDYILPYPIGSGFRIGLSHCSGSLHSVGLPDMFAVDFDMGIGEQVTAARSGTVVFIEQSGLDGGFPNNMVILQHQDGTFGIYMHLTHQGAAVSMGESVPQGALIGYSGNTGPAGYPNLHFVVSTDGYVYPYQSIPINFRNTVANERGPESGRFYQAMPLQ